MLRRYFFIAALALAGAASATTLDRTLDRTLDVQPGTKIQLDNVNGSVTVRAWDQPRVRVRAQEHVEAWDSDAAKSGMNALRIEITPSAGALRIHTVVPKNHDGIFEWLAGMHVETSVQYELFVPRAANVDVETVNGRVEANGVRGATRLATTNGRIEAIRCGGALEASTTNGRISVDMVNATRVNLSTVNGHITLSVPRTLAARLDAQTTHGAIETQLPIFAVGRERNALRGTMNGGGSGDVRLRTVNGGIDIRAM